VHPPSIKSAIIRTARSVLPWLLLVSGLCAVPAAHAQQTYRFGGDAIANCPFDKKEPKTYNCTAMPLTGWNDRMVIESGYTVAFKSSIAFGYNHSLTMSGSARLTSTGDLNIGDIAPSGTLISGGSFQAGGKFTIGNQNQKITANITAGSMQLGSGSGLEIVGNLIAKNGTIVVAHNSIITGDITAQVVELLASNVVITGTIDAKRSLTLGSGVRVNGYVDTGLLTLESAAAMIKGSAKVDRADLYHHGRVTDFIQCRSGATVSDCSCVNNQSMYPFSSELGPKCGQAKPPESSALDHFRISHDGSGSVCAAEAVTVTACANPNCSAPHYTGGAKVTLLPGNASADTGSTGVVTTSVARTTVGTEALRLTMGDAMSCYNTVTGKADCNMAFSGGVNLAIAANPFRAGVGGKATITATQLDEQSKTCVAAFQGQVKQIGYACRYGQPDSGSETLSVKPAGGTASAALACTSGAVQTLATGFSSAGVANVDLNYEDAGKLTLRATHEGAKDTTADDAAGETAVQVAPYAFGFSDLPAAPVRAGDAFGVTIRALSSNNKVTQNFDLNRLAAGATKTDLSVDCVFDKNAAQGMLQGTHVEFVNGQASASPSWSEVGRLHLKAVTAATFLQTNMLVEGRSGEATSCDSVGPFIPKYFLVEHHEQPRTPNNMFYAGEPIPLRVTAKNAQGATTLNYANGLASEAVALSAVDENSGATINPNGGVVVAGTIAAAAFQAGVAQAAPAYAPAPAAAPAKRTPLVPTAIRLRASNVNPDADKLVTSAGNAAHEKARPEIRSGRLRIATLFGRAGSTLELPVTAEYWSGRSWLLNNRDDFTIVPAAAIAQTSHAHANGSGAKPKTQVFSDLHIKGGKAKLPVQGDTAGWIDVAFNLGAGAGLGPDQSCLNSHPQTSFANLPWLQSLSGCTDPSGRATFGIFAPESRRIIHMREVFN